MLQTRKEKEKNHFSPSGLNGRNLRPCFAHSAAKRWTQAAHPINPRCCLEEKCFITSQTAGPGVFRSFKTCCLLINQSGKTAPHISFLFIKRPEPNQSIMQNLTACGTLRTARNSRIFSWQGPVKVMFKHKCAILTFSLITASLMDL